MLSGTPFAAQLLSLGGWQGNVVGWCSTEHKSKFSGKEKRTRAREGVLRGFVYALEGWFQAWSQSEVGLRADFRPGRADFRLAKTTFRPERTALGLGRPHIRSHKAGLRFQTLGECNEGQAEFLLILVKKKENFWLWTSNIFCVPYWMIEIIIVGIIKKIML